MIQKEELFIKGRYRSEDGLYRLTYSDAYGKRTSVYSKDKKNGCSRSDVGFLCKLCYYLEVDMRKLLEYKNSIIKMNM